jgi:hypothetical protein
MTKTFGQSQLINTAITTPFTGTFQVNDVKYTATDSNYTGNAWGRVVTNGAGVAWTPAALTGGGNLNYHTGYYPGTGLTNRAGKTAADLWGSYVNAQLTVATTSNAMANSHFQFNYAYGVIPAGLTPLTSIPAGPWAPGALMTSGVPTDPAYQEMGGFSTNLYVGTAGNYLEGVGIQVHDYDGTNAAVAAPMTAGLFIVDKKAADNRYASYGVMSYATGAQQTTYAAYAAYAVAGGWQIGLDLSKGAYHGYDIQFQSGHGISTNSSAIFFNVSSTNRAVLGAYGLGVTGNVIATGNLQGSNLPAAESAYTSSIASSAGALSTAAIVSAYTYRVGNLVYFDVFYSITTVGSATGNLHIGLPTTATSTAFGAASGVSSSFGLSGIFDAGNLNYMTITGAGSLQSPCVVGNGHVSGWYMSAT